MNQKYFYYCGIFVPFTYIILYILGGTLRPGYSQIAESVSELLSPGSPNKTLLDIINITFASFFTLFGIGVMRFVINSGFNTLLGRIGAGCIIAVGVASIGSAIFPQDATGTPATLPGILHIIFVFAIQIPGSILSTLLIGLWAHKTGSIPGFSIYSLISTGLIVVSGIIAGLTMNTKIMGLVERSSAIVVHQWIFFLALRLLRLSVNH